MAGGTYGDLSVSLRSVGDIMEQGHGKHNAGMKAWRETSKATGVFGRGLAAHLTSG
jgi:hypothetical protein